MDRERLPKEGAEIFMLQIAALQATPDRLTAATEEKDRIIAAKIKLILDLNRARFGQRSGKRTHIPGDGQISLFERTGNGNTEKAPEEETIQ